MSLVDDWYAPRLTLKTALLVPTAQLYRCAFALVRGAPKRQHAYPCAVVVVGNLTVGGTGKTPLTLHLANELTRRGFKVGVISRGYPASPSHPRQVQPEDAAQAVGDEPLLYARAGHNTFVCARRTLALEALLAYAPHTRIVLADDALQHTALPRDVELCLVDARRGLGNGYTLPAGPLREPQSRLQSVDAVVVNGGSPRTVPGVATFSMHVEITALCDLAGTVVSAERLAGKVTLVAGIGQPDRFFEAVVRAFPDLAAAPRFPFPDHHPFSVAELNALPGDTLLMTEKDAVRCAKMSSELNKRVLAAAISVRTEPSLADWLVARLNTKEAHRHGSQTA